MAIARTRLAAFLVLATLALSASGFAQAKSGLEGNRKYQQFIVKFRAGSAVHGNAMARQRLLTMGASEQGAQAAQVRRMGVGADVIRTSVKLGPKAAQAFMARLRQNPDVEYVEIDQVVKRHLTPNDTFYASHQWHYSEAVGGINLPPTWDIATGAGVVVAVIDTGITAHTDLSANLVAGYDFISDAATARDGNGRDADPSDLGDWNDEGECDGESATESSWHGTHVTGTVAAVTNNAKGVAGVAFNAKVMPLRVLGKCGGFSSDTADAILWASGGAVPGVPANANPVEVINLSLGGEGACAASTQNSINAAVAAGVVVVVSSGNDGVNASAYQPASCANVVVVGATGRNGSRAGYSNFGSILDISAPGGDGANFIASTVNSGTTSPSAEAYAGFQGTSMAAPHVAGVVALMQSTAPSSPASVEGILKASARALPVACPEGCGAGIVNSLAAVLAGGNGALTVSDQAVTEGDAGTKLMTFTVNLSKPMPTVVTFDVATANNTASAGSDYVALSLPGQSIAAGATSKTISVTINGDTAIEPNESFFLNVSNVVGIAVADPQGQGTITNDDIVALANGVAVNGLIATTGQQLLYKLEVPAGRTSLAFTTSGGTGDADLFVKFGSVPIPSSGGFDCVSQSDTTTELCDFDNPPPGTYYVMVLAFTDISGVSLMGQYLPVVAVPVSISIADASTTEGDAGSKLLNFTASLSAASANPVTFDVATAPGTASDAGDFVARTTLGQVIAAGQTSGTFTVTINGDTTVERNETFTVNLSNPVGATISNAQAQGRITNDDLASISIGDAAIVEGSSGQSTLRFDVRLSAPMPSPVTFDIATANGSAASGSDYVARSQLGRYIDAGRTVVPFEVNVNGDALAEGNETFTVQISNVSGAMVADANAVGTINNDDATLRPSAVRVVRVAPVQDLSAATRSQLRRAQEVRVACARAARAGRSLTTQCRAAARASDRR